MAVVSLRITTRFQCEIHLFVQAVEFRVHKSPILSRNMSAVHVFRGFLVSTLYRALFRSLIRRFIRTRVYMVSLLKRTDSRPTSSSRLVSYLRLWCTAVNNPVASILVLPQLRHALASMISLSLVASHLALQASQSRRLDSG